MDADVIVTFLSGILSGVIVAVINHLLTKRRTEVEIKKMEAETEKIRAETQQITSSVETLSATVNYKFTETKESVYYDSSKNFSPHDFQGKEGTFWIEKKVAGPKGRGELKMEKGGSLNVERTNTEGRYEIWLQKYMVDGSEKTFIPKNEMISGQRRLRVSFQAKAIGSEHNLRVVLKDHHTGEWLTNEIKEVSKRNEWTSFDYYFQVSPAKDFIVRIDDEKVKHSPSSVQIRNLVVAEKASED